MRVLLVTDSPEPSGVGEHMLTLANALKLNGHSVSLAFPDLPACAELISRAGAQGIEVQRVSGADWARVLSAGQPEIVHVHAGIGWEGHEITRAAPPDVALVRTEHLPWLLTDPAQIADYADASRRVDAVIAVSGAAAKTWRRAQASMRGPRVPVTSVANGIDTGPKMPRAPIAGTILCVGRFTPQKAHSTLLVALARLHREGIAPRLILAGSGPRQAAMKALAVRLGLEDSVEFLGHRSDIAALMAKAEVLALSSRFEGLPLVVLEAMASGLPVVATRIGGTAEALGEAHPWLVAPANSRQLAKALRHALSDAEMRRDVAAQQDKRFHAEFTASKMAERTAQIYHAALAARQK